MKKITVDMVDWELDVDFDDLSVRGNAIVSGDDELDRKVEDEIIARLDAGDPWAWGNVTVKGTFKNLVAEDYLGCCSYKDEDDFKAGGYYEDMQAVVLAELNSQVEELVEALN